MSGTLSGIRVVEMAGIGPGPFCAMMLADHGAEVIRIERPGSKPLQGDPMLRGRTTLELDLKQPADLARLLELCCAADGLIEGYRPGVMERLGLGPDQLLARNPRLVYGRMTGWGQTGPLAHTAGHDINYIALSGVLNACGVQNGAPVPPINLVGDFGGGGMLLAFGMVSALLAVRMGQSGKVVDCAMLDGSALLMTMMWGYRAQGKWSEERGTNLLDGGAPFYHTYRTADGAYVAFGAIEPQFYAAFRKGLGIESDPLFDEQMNRELWPQQKMRIAELVGRKTRDELCLAFDNLDACFSPVLSMTECLTNPHVMHRGTFVEVDGVIQPAPAPRIQNGPITTDVTFAVKSGPLES